MEPQAEAVVALQPVEIQILGPRGDLAGVIENRGVEEPADADAPFGLEQQAVANR
jgi:hypothetical protein